MITTKDIAWAAGFLEGEGYFGLRDRSIAVCQVQKQPLEHLKNLFGGSINFEDTANHKQKRQPYWRWNLCGSLAVQVMMTVYALMSPKRQERIKAILQAWKVAPGNGHNRLKRFCKRGHEYSPENTYKNGGHSRVCRTCARMLDAKRRPRTV